MLDGARQRFRFSRVLVLACLTAFLAHIPQPSRAQDAECLIEVHDASGALPDPATLCQVANTTPTRGKKAKLCTFMLQLCHNEPGCTVGQLKNTVRGMHAGGLCNSPGRLSVSPSDMTSTGSPCGALVGIKVRAQGKGQCVIRFGARSSDKPSKKDVDKLTLQCMPVGSTCP